MITLIDYGAGNLFSVQKSLEMLGYTSRVAASPAELAGASVLILPGVGAFGQGMEALEESGFATVLPDLIRGGAPFLGICLGMQFLFEESHEMGIHKGLGLLPGAVEPMVSDTLKIPHMGWNSITGDDEVIFAPGADSSHVYFVHSYFRAADSLPKENLAAVCEYTKPFAAAVKLYNAYGMQFHPEKSGPVGLAMLARFMEKMGVSKC